MTTCVLAATGYDSGPLLLVIAIVLLVAGSSAWLLLGRRKRGASTAVFAAVPLLVLALVASGGVSATPASAAEPCPPTTSSPTPTPTDTPVDFEPGAAGIGDSYFPLDGNGGYDVQHYDLDLAYAPDTDVISGTTTVTAVATQNLSAFNLDFDTRDVNGDDAITISSITVDGKAATWSLASTQISMSTGQPQVEGSTDNATPPRTELTVVPPAGIPLGATVTTAVTYSGVPIVVADAFGPAGVFPTPTGAVIVGQPRVAATWFPSNDHPSDKATFSTRMTVPTGLEVIGNGRLAGRQVTGDTETFDWEMEQPMATYLATATLGDFDVETNTVAGITYVDAIDPRLFSRNAAGGGGSGVKVGDVAKGIFETEPQVIDFLSTNFGPYPFSEAGGIAIGYINEGDPTATPPVKPRDLPYALENQTRPIYPAFAFRADSDASVVVHELAHQWYGDDLSMNRWSDIWLNEGFATYAEWLWAEEQGGPTTQESFQDAYDSEPDDSDFWGTIVADPGAAGIFDDAVYARGAMTLQALRNEVGDTAFRAILKGWATENAGTSVSTAQLVDYAEKVSGQDLTEFFNTWIYTAGKPQLG